MTQSTYQPLKLEQKWYQFWEKAGYFCPAANKGSPYCIMLPPPNVTGTLHMGHAFQDAIMDALIRYHRMKGHQTLWQGGTDHAGIATQMVVERQLHQLDLTKHDLGREEFVNKVWEWKNHSGDTISRQMRRLGASIDWTRERFTMDEGLSDAVHEVFVSLYDEGLIYRGKRLVNWDPKLHTAVSDLEVISEEEPGHLWYIRYPVCDKNEHLVVATTRPETMLGDVAVAVHPDDQRYQHLIGANIQLPLCNRQIPIIKDEYVDPEFGTGCVKITPAHDFNDYEIGKRHQLEMINIFTIDATLNNQVPTAYQGMERFQARKKIVEDLQNLNLLEKIEPYTLKVPRGDRSGEIIEPYLTDQWYVNVKPLAETAMQVVKDKKIEIIPPVWEKNYFEWMENIQDWCISRQLWWGHRIPAWYDEKGNIYVAKDEPAVRAKYQLPPDVNLIQDYDVLDTWFSSALWPFSTLGWPGQTEELKLYYPTSVLVTGFDILFFWVARMVMMGLKFMKDVPFKQVLVTGLILDSHGQKMSKSKGNILDPLDLIDGIDLDSLVEKRLSGLMQPHMAKQIEKNTRKEFPEGIPSFGTDALRFSLCAFATTNRFIRFDLSRVEGYRNFCNKIWNAARFVFMHLEGQTLKPASNYSLTDRWIWSVWQKTKANIAQHFTQYRFDLLAQTLYEFTWNQFCDWYVEFAKITLSQGDAKQQYATRFTLIAILEELLRALHPIMPFITEEVWQQSKEYLDPSYFSQDSDIASIMIQAYPEPDEPKIDDTAESSIALIQAFIIGLRTIRGEMNLPPNKMLAAFYRSRAPHDIFAENQSLISNCAKLDKLQNLNQAEPPPFCATYHSTQFDIFVPLEGVIDIEAEIQRLEKELQKHLSDKAYYEKKFQNENYVNKAPTEIVAKEREILKNSTEAIQKLEHRISEMKQHR